MRDIDMKVYRPVSLPQKFFGAPALPATFSFMFCVLVFIGLLFFDLQINVLVVVLGFIGAMFGGHVLLVSIGAMEPHLSTMIQTLRKSRQTARSLDRGRSHVFNP